VSTPPAARASSPERHGDERVDRDDVDDVVELATRMVEEERDALGVADLHAVGAELDLPPEVVDRARRELARRRAEEARVADERRARRMRRARVALITGGAAAGILGVWSAASLGPLRDRHEAVTAQAAQVENVRARQRSIEQLLQGRPPSPDRDAELIGAENRVRVETQRYALAAAAYNEAAARFPASVVRSLAGLPAEVPVVP
jgi:hypothetical protein